MISENLHLYKNNLHFFKHCGILNGFLALIITKLGLFYFYRRLDITIFFNKSKYNTYTGKRELESKNSLLRSKILQYRENTTCLGAKTEVRVKLEEGMHSPIDWHKY